MNVSPMMFVGAVLGALALVRLFLLIAGVSFSSGRQILAAYLACASASVFIYAAGLSDGGPPNYAGAPLQVFGATVAAVIDYALLLRSTRARPGRVA